MCVGRGGGSDSPEAPSAECIIEHTIYFRRLYKKCELNIVRTMYLCSPFVSASTKS